MVFLNIENNSYYIIFIHLFINLKIKNQNSNIKILF